MVALLVLGWWYHLGLFYKFNSLERCKKYRPQVLAIQFEVVDIISRVRYEVV